ncbi:MAG: hypothetical protein DSY76_08375 [Bacteroidetes bacterium]|nr:MAG: hypothetical protein DSY76_08375 [Bacteroidota bacterium]
MYKIFIVFILLFTLSSSLDAQKNVELNYALIEVAAEGNLDSLIQILKKDPNLDFRDANSGTALYYAVQNNHLDIVKVLVFNGADMDYSLDDGFTPLMCACYNGYFDIAEFLARSGANTNDRDQYWATALHYSVAIDDYYMADMLLFYGAKPDLLTYEKISPLFVSCLIGDTAIASILLKKGANINRLTETGDSPLSIAIQQNDSVMFDFLLVHHADVNTAIKTKYEPFSWALLNKNKYAFEKLKPKNPSLISTKNNRYNPLNIAYSVGDKDFVAKMKSEGYSSGLMPFFDAISTHAATSFNGDDAFYSFGLGLEDAKYNMGFELNFGTRFKKKAVLFEESDGTYLQLWEGRNFLEFAALKSFPVKLEMMNMSLYAGLGAQFMLGGYNGVRTKLKPSVAFVPKLGLNIELNPLCFIVGYEYTPYKLNGISNHKFSVGIGYRFQFIKKPKRFELIWME